MLKNAYFLKKLKIASASGDPLPNPLLLRRLGATLPKPPCCHFRLLLQLCLVHF